MDGGQDGGRGGVGGGGGALHSSGSGEEEGQEEQQSQVLHSGRDDGAAFFSRGEAGSEVFREPTTPFASESFAREKQRRKGVKNGRPVNRACN